MEDKKLEELTLNPMEIEHCYYGDNYSGEMPAWCKRVVYGACKAQIQKLESLGYRKVKPAVRPENPYLPNPLRDYDCNCVEAVRDGYNEALTDYEAKNKGLYTEAT